jgi:MFS family permease
VSGNEAFAKALIEDPPSAWSRGQIFIYCFSFVGFLCSTMNGYDGSLINNLLQNPWFREKYGVESSGIWAGIVSAMYQIGGVVALPFVGPVLDGFGRRVGMLSGSALIVVGTIIQGLSHSSGQFMGGRFLLGFGVSLAASAGPMYVIEMNHPVYRGRVGGKLLSYSFSSPQFLT